MDVAPRGWTPPYSEFQLSHPLSLISKHERDTACSIYFPIVTVAVVCICQSGSRWRRRHERRQGLHEFWLTPPILGEQHFLLHGARNVAPFDAIAPRSDLGCHGVLDLPLECVCSRRSKKVAPKVLRICHCNSTLVSNHIAQRDVITVV